QPAPPLSVPGEHPLLAQLNQETRQLYSEVRPSVVRVQMPIPRWTTDYAMRSLARWQQLDPEVRQRLTLEQSKSTRTEQIAPGVRGSRSYGEMRSVTPPSPQSDGDLSANTIFVNPAT